MENVLLKECIESLETKTIHINCTAEKIFTDFEEKLIFTSYRLIDKEKNKYLILKNILEIEKFINRNDTCFVIWDNENLPIIETVIEDVLKNLDDVLCVHYDTWLWIKGKEIVIEFNHNDEIVLFSLSNDFK